LTNNFVLGIFAITCDELLIDWIVTDYMIIRIKQAVIIILFSAALAVIVNLASGSRIPFVGDWPSISGSDSVAVPPSAEEGDPPFISLDEAAARYQSPGTLFIDARDPEDYAVAHVRNAVNIPYDYLDDYHEQLMMIPVDREIVIYCSGSECELSLFLGRDMQDIGYQRIFIFYGGWREWERANLPVEKGEGIERNQ